MTELTEEQTKALQAYREVIPVKDGKSINVLLREGETCKEMQILDEMMTTGNTPNVLFQATTIPYVKTNIIEENEVRFICDKAFLSTKNKIFSHEWVNVVEPAILIIDKCSNVPSIDIEGLLSETTDNHEFILPRNIKLKIIGMERYNHNESLEEFVTKYPQIIFDTPALRYTTPITIYKVEPIEWVAEK